MSTATNSPSTYRYVRKHWHVVFRAIDAIGYRCKRFFSKATAAPPLPAADVRRVLLVQLDHLGDAVLTTSMLPALRRHYRHAAIDVLAAPWNAEVFASRREIAKIHVSKWNRFRRGFRWLWPVSMVYWAWKLRSRYDVAIDVRGDFPTALMMRLMATPRRVGWPDAGGGFLLTDHVLPETGRHEVESRRAVLTAIDASVPRSIAPSFTPTPEAERFVGHMLGDFRRGSRSLIAVHIGAGTKAKTWPVEHWRELIGRMIVEFDANVVLVGGASDAAAARAITQDRYWPNVMNFTGRLTLDHLGALARRADVFVGADSGPAHLASAVGANVVVIFSGSAEVDRWRPWGERVRVVHEPVACSPCHRTECPMADHPCITGITPARVIDAIAAFIDVPTLLPMARPSSFRAGRRGGPA